jgi:hypothetical protein
MMQWPNVLNVRVSASNAGHDHDRRTDGDRQLGQSEVTSKPVERWAANTLRTLGIVVTTVLVIGGCFFLLLIAWFVVIIGERRAT